MRSGAEIRPGRRPPLGHESNLVGTESTRALIAGAMGRRLIRGDVSEELSDTAGRSIQSRRVKARQVRAGHRRLRRGSGGIFLLFLGIFHAHRLARQATGNGVENACTLS